jgi:Holliday junction resolvasome RuvABC endonuclease subunit
MALPIPVGYAPYRIMAIDPGTNTLGVCVIDVDLVRRTMSLIFVGTFHASRSVNRIVNNYNVFTERLLRIKFHEQNIVRLLYQYQPHCFIAESPYMGKFANAFESLVELKTTIRKVLWYYDPAMTLELVDPPTAKMAVGAKVFKGSKENVQESVIKYKDLQWNLPDNTIVIDEHGYDAIAVGVYKAQLVLAHTLYI